MLRFITRDKKQYLLHNVSSEKKKDVTNIKNSPTKELDPV